MTGLEVARGFINAVRERDADTAAELCTEAVEVLLPGADAPLRGKEGVRQMIRMAPQFLQSMRDEEERDGEVRITTLTRAPGVFANYTTWIFVIDGGKIDRGRRERLAARVLDADRRSGDRLDDDVDELGRWVHDERVDGVESGERRAHDEAGGLLDEVARRCADVTAVDLEPVDIHHVALV